MHSLLQIKNGLILSFNPSAESLFGYQSEEVIGKKCQNSYPPPPMQMSMTVISVITSIQEIPESNRKENRENLALKEMVEQFIGAIYLDETTINEENCFYVNH